MNTVYLTSKSLGHAAADDLLRNMNGAIGDLELKKIKWAYTGRT